MSSLHLYDTLTRRISPFTPLVKGQVSIYVCGATEPSWPTPLGAGRPGWHLECSAMAYAYLGESFDIHGGGLDLVFPHHENEMAQSQAAGYGFAKRWLHNAWVTQSGEKMSKSLGNDLQVTQILKVVRGIELRWYLGSAHYRSMLEYSEEALLESATAFRRIENFLNRATQILGKQPSPVLSKTFTDAMNQDLAVPQALASISENLRLGNAAITDQDKNVISKNANEIRGALEILGCDPFDSNFSSTDNSGFSTALDGVIKLALVQRDAARERKDFAASDEIRDGLSALGINIEDTAQGPRWSISRTRVALDGITDPRNLGAIVRSAAAFGADGVVMTERRAAAMTASAWRSSAGAAARMPIGQVTNLARTIDAAKKLGCFVIGLDGESDEVISKMKVASESLMIVVGSEGKGLARLTREKCDLVVSIPISATTESLNASVATSIALFWVDEQRRK